MNNKVWSHLPNAEIIDWVLRSLKENSELWEAARKATWNSTQKAAREAAWAAAWDAVWNASRVEVWNASRDAAWSAAQNGTWVATRNATLALIAYDDSAKYLQMTYEKLKMYAILSENPQAILLLPIKWVQENEKVDLHQECA